MKLKRFRTQIIARFPFILMIILFIPSLGCASFPEENMSSWEINRSDSSDQYSATIREVDEINEYITSHALPWTAGMNSFMMLSPEEREHRKGLNHHDIDKKNLTIRSGRSITARSNLPSSFDWRNNGGDWTTPVRDQGSCGGCWAFSTTGVFESYYEIVHNNPDLNPDFAEQYLIDCASDQNGCDGGLFTSLSYFVDKAGSCGTIGTVTESDYPYTSSDGSCKSLAGHTLYHTNSGDYWYYVGDGSEYEVPSVDAIKTAVYDYGPVVAGIYADGYFDAYTSGIMISPTSATEANHAVIIVGWGTDGVRPYFICKNSWGTGWGESGWFRIGTDQLRIGEGAAYFSHPSSPVSVPGICIFRNGMFLLDYDGNYGWSGSGSTSVTDRIGMLGQNGDTPLISDWNNDGIDEIGIFRNGMFLLDYDGNYGWSGSGTTSTTDRIGMLGQNGDTPLTGDWNGDRKVEIGIFRNGMFLLDYDGNYGWSGSGSTSITDRIGMLGQSGDTPLTGDWNGDGKDEIGIFRNGMFLLDYDGNYGWSGGGITSTADRIGMLGQNGDSPFAGIWSISGTTSVQTVNTPWQPGIQLQKPPASVKQEESVPPITIPVRSSVIVSPLVPSGSYGAVNPLAFTFSPESNK